VRHLVVALVLSVGALRTAAAEPPSRSSVDVIIPVEPEEHQRLHYFGRRHHHLVPGTATINRAPYVCDVDTKAFRDRDEFVAHLRMAHGVPPETIPDRLLVREGVVHFLADGPAMRRR
jgi:hypothetical protein